MAGLALAALEMPMLLCRVYNVVPPAALRRVLESGGQNFSPESFVLSAATATATAAAAAEPTGASP